MQTLYPAASTVEHASVVDSCREDLFRIPFLRTTEALVMTGIAAHARPLGTTMQTVVGTPPQTTNGAVMPGVMWTRHAQSRSSHGWESATISATKHATWTATSRPDGPLSIVR